MRKSFLRSLAAGVAAVVCGGSAGAQTLTTNMMINMTVATAATVAQTAMNWGSIAPVPGGTAVMNPATGAITGGGVLVTSTGTPGVITLTRNVAMTATLTPPGTVSMTCGTATVTINNFASAAGGTSCAVSASGDCTWNVGASASFPSGPNIPTGACTAASALMTVTYGP